MHLERSFDSRTHGQSTLVLPVKREDAHEISIFLVEAEATAPLSGIFYPSPGDRKRAEKNVENRILMLLHDPTWMLLKVLDQETGEAASFAGWQRVAPRQGGEEEHQNERVWVAGMNRDLVANLQSSAEERKDLTKYLLEEQAQFMSSWAKDMNYIELQILATAPRFQRRGYASALLNWGHNKADAERQVCFLLGSPAGRPLYAALGWKEVGQIVADMREWVPGGDRGDLGLGTWRLYHMIRLPKAVSY
jgi:GNAT superfamily N-acetyltransferase